ncbi:MAG: YceI family protein [Candidatus Krumholzibacteriota bacterium]|nr:YceI family protein [Candidatus Krumholzibacteriota bacterium]
MKRALPILAAALLVAALAAPAPAARYAIDTSHSSVGFVVKHLVVSKVRGSFDAFSGAFDFDAEDTAAWRVEATIDAASIDTGNGQRDDHLRSADFFEVAKYPALTFASTKAVETAPGEYALHGELTMHGVTKPVVLALEYNGSIQDPWGGTRVGFSARGTIDRKDFGLEWNKILEGGGLTVSDEVEILIEVEGVQEK